MDIAANQQQRMDVVKMPSPKINENNLNHIKAINSVTVNDTTKVASVKRSFDVAFLMLPDEKLMKQREKLSRIENNNNDVNVSDDNDNSNHNNNNNNNSDNDLNRGNSYQSDIVVRTDLTNRQMFQHVEHNLLKVRNNTQKYVEFYNEQTNKMFKYSSPPLNHPLAAKIYEDPNFDRSPIADIPRSAFSKVTQSSGNNNSSPIPPPAPLSPDQLSCPSSSPPICASPSSDSNSIYTNFRPEYPFVNGSAFQAINQPRGFVQQSNQKFKQFMYQQQQQHQQQQQQQHQHHQQAINFEEKARQQHQQQQQHQAQHQRQLAANDNHPQNFITNQGPAFPFAGAAHHPFMGPSDMNGIIRNPAAAILSTLLPTTLSPFSLPAQNVCAKCNISFRMTSDLVYHMRSHHKGDYVYDPNRRKREEKLKCPVCSENFRERHHLTRHMTAHQDKEGDILDGEGHELLTSTSHKRHKQL